jgi:DNA-binding CsgD family transcriptional regulator
LDLTIAVLDDQIPGPSWGLITKTITRMLNGTAGLFTADQGATSESRHDNVLAWTRNTSLVRANARSLEHAPTHPLYQIYARGEQGPLTVSDVVDETVWRRNSSYLISREEVDGATRHLGVPMPAPPGAVRCLLVCRPGRDFSTRDREFARRIQPLLIRLDRHLIELQKLHASLPAPVQPAAKVGVSPRELTVLALLAEGLTAVAIARRLTISSHTVTKHQENLYRKLGTNDRLTTVLLGQDLGLIATPVHSWSRRDTSAE